jgi:hypothetical protein
MDSVTLQPDLGNASAGRIKARRKALCPRWSIWRGLFIPILHKTVEPFCEGHKMRPGGAAAKNVANTCAWRHRRCGVIRRNKKVF